MIERIGRRAVAPVQAVGRFGHFLADLARAVPDVATWGRLTPVQMRRIGVDSLPVALFIAAFTGVVLALQASYTFTGAVPLYFVGTLVGKTMMLELGLVQTAFDSQAVSDLRRSIRDFSQIADRLVRVTDEQADVIGSVGTNLRKGSDYLAQAATDLQATLGRVDSATTRASSRPSSTTPRWRARTSGPPPRTSASCSTPRTRTRRAWSASSWRPTA